MVFGEIKRQREMKSQSHSPAHVPGRSWLREATSEHSRGCPAGSAAAPAGWDRAETTLPAPRSLPLSTAKKARELFLLNCQKLKCPPMKTWYSAYTESSY